MKMMMNPNIINSIPHVPLRACFAVSNSYVWNKLHLLLFPFRRHGGNWARQVPHTLPRHDINAPDLYVPIMSFVTWIIVSSISLVGSSSFSPQAFGGFASRGLSIVIAEVAIFKSGFYLLSDAETPPLLDLIAWSGYKFVGFCVTRATYIIACSNVSYAILLYCACATAFVLREQQRAVWQSAPGTTWAGQLFRLATMALQFMWYAMVS